MSFNDQRDEIIRICKTLMEEKIVGIVLACASDETLGKTVPRFIRDVTGLDALIWDETCTPNLAKYLLEKKEKVAIVAKPCDARAIVMYLTEKQLDRKQVFIIGVECEGMTDRGGKPAPGCNDCDLRTPPLYDVLIKNTDNHRTVSNIKTSSNIEKNEEKPVLELSLKRFQNEIEKCILCYSCKQACYGCYCKTCFMDRNIPNWLPKDIGTGEKMVFHLGRAMHLAGRCVECGACERACPSGVKIRYLIKEITDMCKELYGYSSGMSLDDISAIASFNINDREVGFLGGENDACCNSKE